MWSNSEAFLSTDCKAPHRPQKIATLSILIRNETIISYLCYVLNFNRRAQLRNMMMSPFLSGGSFYSGFSPAVTLDWNWHFMDCEEVWGWLSVMFSSCLTARLCRAHAPAVTVLNKPVSVCWGCGAMICFNLFSPFSDRKSSLWEHHTCSAQERESFLFIQL